MTVHTLSTKRVSDPVQQAKVDLAAALRLAVLHQLEEGIDNHFTVTVPGVEDHYLVLPFGLHWSEARASDMIIFDEAGNTLEGDGEVELTAQCIHAPIHRITGARVVMHTHQPWALALNMLEDNRLISASQTAALFHNLIVYDNDYAGVADSLEEGERLAHLLQDKPVMFMQNHGVLVVGETIAHAYRSLHFLERVCRTQILAMSSGKTLLPIPDDVIAQVNRPTDNDKHKGRRAHLYFEAMKRVLNRELPGYAE
ncbi:MAG: class II aldolase/adducin family protein [Arenicellales bacterium WSBS_2016_MAG_OTU3]